VSVPSSPPGVRSNRRSNGNRIAIGARVVLALAAIGTSAGWYTSHASEETQRRQAADQVADIEHQLAETQSDLDHAPGVDGCQVGAGASAGRSRAGRADARGSSSRATTSPRPRRGAADQRGPAAGRAGS